MMSGASARTAASPKPMRSITPLRKFWMNTSAPAISRFSASTPSGAFRSSTIERLLRLLLRNEAEYPPRRLAAARVWSPPCGFSTLMTSAPWSASSIVADGPDTIEVRSTMR